MSCLIKHCHGGSSYGLFPSENDVPEPIETYLKRVTEHPVLSSTRIETSTAGNVNGNSSPPNRQTVGSCKAEILRLEDEIAQLEDVLFQEEFKVLEIPTTTLEEIGEFYGINESDSATAGEEETILKKVQLQEAFTGIRLDDVISRVLEQTPERTVRVQTIDGACSDLEFKVKFEVIETEVTEKSTIPALAEQEHRAQITKLEISVDHVWVRNDINAFISQMTQSCSLQPFLRGFQQYSGKFSERKKAYDHFVKTYPGCVSLYPNNDLSILQFFHPVQRGIVYTVTWLIQITPHSNVEENFSLDVFATEQMQRRDRRNILDKAPEKFQKMIKLRGIERAVDTLIQAVSSY
ncbi:putative centromere protein P [Apostichopus japonicus]|uniref:Putative centromere protein P n=1 Tax=Stichopus japonicus TaxID=307972 RepID=A0A2G8LCI1_STIJA|nr:putative centromere protein P [Apostichopus japonicus]